jgi:hypothetical protein
MFTHVYPYKRKTCKLRIPFQDRDVQIHIIQTAKQLSQFTEYELLAPFPGKRQLIMPWHSSIQSTPPHFFSKFIFIFPKPIIRDIKSRIMKWEGIQQVLVPRQILTNG